MALCVVVAQLFASADVAQGDVCHLGFKAHLRIALMPSPVADHNGLVCGARCEKHVVENLQGEVADTGGDVTYFQAVGDVANLHRDNFASVSIISPACMAALVKTTRPAVNWLRISTVGDRHTRILMFNGRALALLSTMIIGRRQAGS